jgi:uncharacterized protein YecT (DUF1311 family)
MNRNALVLACFISMVGCAGFSADVELAKLEKAFRKAETQTDMNIASGQIAEYLNKKLIRLEEKIEKDIAAANGDATPEGKQLRAKQLKAFQKAVAVWRSYRDAHVEWVASDYEGGSISSLACNSDYSALTRQRINLLIRSSQENAYDDFKNE